VLFLVGSELDILGVGHLLLPLHIEQLALWHDFGNFVSTSCFHALKRNVLDDGLKKISATEYPMPAKSIVGDHVSCLVP
jgi:hypothetical protein